MSTTFFVDSLGMGIDQSRQYALRHLSPIASLIGLDHGPTASKLKHAIEDVLEHRRHRLIIWRPDQSILGTLLSIRPAREPGFAVLSLTDLDVPMGNLSPDDLIEFFMITRAEAEIGIALYCGLDLAMIALQRKVSPETVRGQVKSVLRKTGVQNQKQLTLLLCRVGLALPDDRENNPFGGLPRDLYDIHQKSED